MADIAQEHRDRLPKLKTYVESAYAAYRNNYKRFNAFRKFVYQTTLDDDDIAILTQQKKPVIEFNIQEPYVSRLLGEYSKQEPGILVSNDDGDQVNPQTINVVEGHLKHIFFRLSETGADSEVYKDQVTGGWGVYRICTKRAKPMSTKQIICIEKEEPSLCGFDPGAKLPTRADGKYCFRMYPKALEDFKDEYPDIDVNNIKYNDEIEGFRWCYRDEKDRKIVLLCEFFLKTMKKVKIVEAADGVVRTKKEYDKFIEQWHLDQKFAQPPVIVGEPITTEIPTITRYVFIKDRLLQAPEKTDYQHLPLVYAPGSEVMLREGENGASYIFTKPYTYHLLGTQKLKNYAGQCWANHLENSYQSKLMVAKEGIPQEEDYQEALKSPQSASVIVYNALNNNNPDQPLPPPQATPFNPMPPEVSQAFMAMDQLSQMILGSYDAALGVNDNQLSGVAIVEAATQSNATAMPYIVGNLLAKQQLAEIIVDWLPKYYKTPRTIPVVDKQGKESFVEINKDNNVSFNYDENALKVKVTAGPSFQVQKNKALQQFIGMMKTSEVFDQFINAKGLSILLDNMEGRGIDQLKEMAPQWMQQMQQQRQQSQQNDPNAMKAKLEQAKLAQKDQESKAEYQLGMAKIMQDQQQLEADLALAKDQHSVQLLKAQTERFARELEAKMKMLDMAHQHANQVAGHRHEISKFEHEVKQSDKQEQKKEVKQ